MLLDLIPAQYRIVALGVALAVACAASAAGGAVVAGWKADADHSEVLQDLNGQIQQLKDDKHELELSIAKQNTAIEVAKAKTDAATEAKAAAEKHAEEMAVLSASRIRKLESILQSATSGGEVLSSYWELRQ